MKDERAIYEALLHREGVKQSAGSCPLCETKFEASTPIKGVALHVAQSGQSTPFALCPVCFDLMAETKESERGNLYTQIEANLLGRHLTGAR